MDASSQKQITWHKKILPPPTNKALDLLSAQSRLKKSAWYLADGTALALQAGHRKSVDLDFFTAKAIFMRHLFSSILKHTGKQHALFPKLPGSL